MTDALRHYYLGCPIWNNRVWLGEFFSEQARPKDFLNQYASVFNTVEGNSTFYGLPSDATVQRWSQDTPDDFRFCFKFPRTISHDKKLIAAAEDSATFFHRISPLQDRLGPLLLQLPPSFAGKDLPALWTYLDALPSDFNYALEVRHLDFFGKDETERLLNRQLHERSIDRVMFDSRALFSSTSEDYATSEAQRKKPRLPVHAVATAEQPLIRFVGHPDLDANTRFLTPWVKKFVSWIKEGRKPYFFAHMADDFWAPHLACLFHTMLQDAIAEPKLADLATWPAAKQVTLF